MLPIPGPMFIATFLHKPHRFAAIVELNGELVTAHVPTSSRMGELLVLGAEVLLADRYREGRVTRYDLLMARTAEGTLVSVDSRVPNRLLDLLLRRGEVPEFAGWEYARCEVPYGESRLDFLLTRGEERCWIEAKSVTLVEDGIALFPDAATARGARHLGELARARREGDRAAALFIVQRDDAHAFSPNRRLDPNFAGALDRALAQGVEAYAYRCRVTPDAILPDTRIPLQR